MTPSLPGEDETLLSSISSQQPVSSGRDLHNNRNNGLWGKRLRQNWEFNADSPLSFLRILGPGSERVKLVIES